MPYDPNEKPTYCLYHRVYAPQGAIFSQEERDQVIAKDESGEWVDRPWKMEQKLQEQIDNKKRQVEAVRKANAEAKEAKKKAEEDAKKAGIAQKVSAAKREQAANTGT